MSDGGAEFAALRLTNEGWDARPARRVRVDGEGHVPSRAQNLMETFQMKLQLQSVSGPSTQVLTRYATAR